MRHGNPSRFAPSADEVIQRFVPGVDSSSVASTLLFFRPSTVVASASTDIQGRPTRYTGFTRIGCRLLRKGAKCGSHHLAPLNHDQEPLDHEQKLDQALLKFVERTSTADAQKVKQRRRTRV
jgi:hypothetical protein